MKKITIGYLFYEKKLGEDEKAFLDMAKKMNINLLMINLDKRLTIDGIKEQIDQCDIFYNNSGENFSEEIVKTIEELGDRVIASSKNVYYSEDKWLFFLECQKYGIPTPKTILLSEDFSLIKKELKNFNCWPVVLKRIQGTMAEYVDKAENLEEAEKIIRNFWQKGSERLPVIAQEFIKSKSYRVTTIGGKIVQTALKESNRWKTAGNCAENFKRFVVDKDLAEIIKKINKVFGLKICGVDLLKKNGEWVVLEINSAPAFDFFPKYRKKIIGQVLNFLKKESKNY